ncbi:MAG: hypothetical protein JO101_06180 [Candidatus Eremiobacteraeota bacterium]|nr:hypothetical protein [Candidatus Eremiobacteraeota bacterium]
MSSTSVRNSFAVATLAVAFAGCGYRGATSSTALPFAAQIAAPALRHHTGSAYISTAAGVYIYALPLTANSRPVREIGGVDAPGSVGFDPGQIFILVAGSPSGQGILVFEPKGKGPTSYVLPTPLLPEMLETDSAGDIFQGQSYVSGSNAAYQVNVYRAPIKKGAVPAFTMNTAINQKGSTLTRGMAFDTQGNLWVKDDDNQTMDEYVPPFSAKSVPALTFPKASGAQYGSMFFDRKDEMFVANNDASGNGVDVYLPPFTKNTTKAFTINSTLANIVTTDSSGNLYVTSGTGVLYVFTPPFSASSTPAVTMPIPGSPDLSFISIAK